MKALSVAKFQTKETYQSLRVESECDPEELHSAEQISQQAKLIKQGHLHISLLSPAWEFVLLKAANEAFSQNPHNHLASMQLFQACSSLNTIIGARVT